MASSCAQAEERRSPAPAATPIEAPSNVLRSIRGLPWYALDLIMVRVLLRTVRQTCNDGALLALLTLHTSCHQAADQRSLDNGEANNDGDDADDSAGAQHSPRHLKFSDHQLQADRPGARSVGGREEEGPDVLVPGADGDEDGRRRDALASERQDDPNQRSETGRTIDAGRLLQVGWDAIEEPLEHPDAEGQQEGRVGQGQPEMGIEQTQIAEHDEERDEQ